MKQKKILIAVLAIVLIAGIAVWAGVIHKDDGGKDGKGDKETAVETDDEDEDIPEMTIDDDPDDLTEETDMDSGDDPGNGIYYDEEEDSYELKKVRRDVSDFYGTWVADSDMAQYMYDSVEVTVKKGGAWTAKITGERLGGTYDVYDDYLHMNDTIGGLFDFDLAFDRGGKLIMIDSDSEDGDVHTVLTKK